ncbi:putative WSC domain-containing protein 2 [Apostichopus japonicus]|uniref:Putative WSC domain-containing protein 2 n=1 Tax=Stichopus japonicus TaxID=307972 RepID=A0A2G8L1R0_STIJA|nr:putative WSC domain-containing protein 2 [Apostichopus japonicus]
MRFYSRLRNVSMPEIIRSMRNRDERWTKFLPIYAEKWRDTAINWITLCERLMIVFYEDLEENPIHELTRMVKFLGQPVLPRRIQCAVHLYAPMKGRQDHASQMTFDPYTSEMHGIVDGYITEVNRTLLQKNANPLPVYEKYLLSS